jgi:hypothetical protein
MDDLDRRDTMKAIVQDTCGSPDVLPLSEIDTPVIGDDEVLVRVHAAGVDQGVWPLTAGLPYLTRAGCARWRHERRIEPRRQSPAQSWHRPDRSPRRTPEYSANVTHSAVYVIAFCLFGAHAVGQGPEEPHDEGASA